MLESLLTEDSFEPEQWSNWRWQISNSIRTAKGLSKWVNLTDKELSGIEKTSKKYKWQITPYFASLMDKDDPNCPIRLQSIPHNDELIHHSNAEVDPVGDIEFRKTNRIVHKYPDRVIFLLTQTCPVYCRHCTRKFHTTDKEGSYFEKSEGESFEADFTYIEQNPEIRDVLITGGDPLTYVDHKLETVLKRLRSIEHVDIIRLGSRYPVLLPQRITDDFCKMVEKYHPVWFSTHFNHPKELTKESMEACDRLLRSGIPVQNQTVLLKGVNDSVETMRALMRDLLKARVKPYYLYHCDNVSGVSHFMTSVNKGQEIMSGLLGHISGYALPRYIMTTKLGKIPLEKSYIHKEGNYTVIENYKNEVMKLPFGMDDISEIEL